jgi:hypothetical protein
MVAGSVTVRRRALVLLASLGITFETLSTAASAEPALPDSITAIGDSITRATNACCFYGDHPSQSWSTGYNPLGPVNSHYERLVGANDVCTSSRATMTPVNDFRTQFQAAMETLATGLPDSHVLVASIPNVRRLWRILHDDPVARLVWRTASICQSMLSPSNTAADRRAVFERERQFNAVLAEVCALYANCRFDGGAVFGYAFTRAQVSRLDYFHPDLDGQAKLAEITWPRSWWP